MGRRIDTNAVAKIKEGETTQQQVVELLGSPDSYTKAGGVTTLGYTYIHSAAKPATFVPVVGLFAGGADTESQSVTVVCNADGVVQSVSISETGMETRANLGAGTGADLEHVEGEKRAR